VSVVPQSTNTSHTPGSGDVSSIQAVVRDLEDRRYRAMIEADIDTLDALCSEDLVYAHSNSARDDKRDYLGKIASGQFDYHEVEHPIDKLVVSEHCAVVIGHMRARVTNAGRLVQLDNSCLAVWMRTDGRWQFVAYQPTPHPA
jgi:ketosteroid isomerase-like protein